MAKPSRTGGPERDGHPAAPPSAAAGELRILGLDWVVRFSPVGLEVPLNTLTICRHPHAEFNSPFEEFARATELRNASGRVRPGRS